MQLPRLRRADAALALYLLCSSTPVLGASLDCAKISVDGTNFDLSKLSGPHSVVTSRWDPPLHINTTYTLDLCKPLVKKGDACPDATRVCAIGHQINRGEGPGHGEITGPIIPIAGDLKDRGGGDMDFAVTRLAANGSQSETSKGGFQLVLHGGAFPLEAVKGEKREQRAIIDFRCHKDMSGLEGEYTPEDNYETTRLAVRDETMPHPPESTHEKQVLKDELEKTALRFVSYGPEKGDEMLDVLRLTWETQHVCTDTTGAPGDEGPASSHWGFFTWLVIIVFLAVAAYIIFGSWLNYNRYGARGWDLLPHGDTIRDIPYLLKDWMRRVLNTVQGGGSRGGYSAV